MSDIAAVPGAPAVSPRRLVGRAFEVLAVVGSLVLLWQAAGVWTHGIAITPPLPTLAYLSALVLTGMFWEHLAATAGAFALAFGLSAVIGLGLGLVLGLRRFAAEVTEPILAGFYTIPKVTLYPVVLMVFGLGLSAKVAFGVMHGLVPVTLFTLGAVRTLPPVLMRAARSMGLSFRDTMWAVLVPACLPEIVNGLRIGFSLSLLGVLVGEMFSSQRGLGFLLVNGLAQHNVPLSTSVVLVIIVCAVLANTAMLRVGRRVTRLG
jgi:NitT/TauT family transport system permease protein